MTNIASLFVPANEAIPGSVYEAVAFGYYTPGNLALMGCGLSWTGSGNPGQIALPVTGAPADARWRIQATINLYATDLTSSIHFWAARAAPSAVLSPTTLFGPPGAFTFGPGIDAQFGLFIHNQGTGGLVTVLGVRLWRAA